MPTLKRFHTSPAQFRCVVGPVGSGKTTAAAWEVCYYLPQFMFETYKIKRTKWVIVRNSYPELRDTTQRTVFDWFDWGKHRVQANEYILKYPNGMELEILFRSCDRPDDVKKFKSLEVSGYWIDESIEVNEEVKLMLKNRVGRYPRKCPVRWGIETTNPPDVEHPTYSTFAWDTPPPGPVPEGVPLDNHEGFWQPPRENDANLRPGYYDELRIDYSHNPDWVDTYIDGKPGIIVSGSAVFKNFKRDVHVAKERLSWNSGPLYRGWDNSGNWPSCVVISVPTSQQMQVLAEFHGDKMGIVDFTRHVVQECNTRYPNATYQDWADPAGENKFSKRTGGFTSNAELMRDFGVDVEPSEQNWTARKESVEQQLKIIDGLLIDPKCVRLINGFMGGYHYAEIGTSGSFRDKPNKNRWSHCFAAGTMVQTMLGERPIEQIKAGERVLTPFGFKRVLRSWLTRRDAEVIRVDLSNGRSLTVTPKHEVYIASKNKVDLADTLQYADVLYNIDLRRILAWNIQSLSFSKTGSIGFRELITGQTVGGEDIHQIFTEQFGKMRMGPYQMALKSIILMGIRSIMNCRTSNALRFQPTILSMGNGITLPIQTPGKALRPPKKQRRYGMDLMREELGIASMGRTPGKGVKNILRNARFAGLNTRRHFQPDQTIVDRIARIKPEGEEVTTTFKEYVKFVGSLLRLTSTQKEQPVPGVVGVESLAEPKDVYNLTVEDDHVYFANGVLVNNCHDALQYGLVKLGQSQSAPIDPKVLKRIRDRGPRPGGFMAS